MISTIKEFLLDLECDFFSWAEENKHISIPLYIGTISSIVGWLLYHYFSL